MPPQATLKKKAHDERRRVLDACHAGRDGVKNVKVTPVIKKILEGYLNECCSYTPRTLQEFFRMDFNVNLLTSTRTRIEPTTRNNETNKEKRKQFVEALVKHHRLDNLVIYFDETNYNFSMCNPIENCFSVLKSHIKEYLAQQRLEMTQAPTARTATGSLISTTEARMRLLERATHVSMPKITQQLVVTMELHARDS
ncbi:Major Facilitator Superfamily (MFS) [Phytophthora palmivora]|uniref:Major Facilitator Superfamily (MFS) n=1 Tax=Phytophthora palmivora TaxID=4796 RepID=A0A2P4Y6Q3_9STRA|nr:Major Facilitator Superfamily (MFS) [Phytophthora palmivora]